MKKLAYLLLICLAALMILPFISCKEPEAPNTIEGDWIDLTGSIYPDWHYHFERGILTQKYEKFGATLTTITFPYATRGDSVFIGGNSTNDPRIWVLSFECADVVKVQSVSATFGPTFWLTRE